MIAKESRMEELRRLKADLEVKEATFKPDILRAKSQTPKPVIRRGRVVSRSPSKKEKIIRQKKTYSRLLRYGREKNAKHIELKSNKDQLEERLWDHQP